MTGKMIHFVVVNHYEINLLLLGIQLCLVFYYGIASKDDKLTAQEKSTPGNVTVQTVTSLHQILLS